MRVCVTSISTASIDINVMKGYCQLLDTSANKYFFKNNNHIIKVPTGKLQPLPAPVPYTHDPKIYIQNKARVPVPDTQDPTSDFDVNLTKNRIPIHKPMTRSQRKKEVLLQAKNLKDNLQEFPPQC